MEMLLHGTEVQRLYKLRGISFAAFGKWKDKSGKKEERENWIKIKRSNRNGEFFGIQSRKGWIFKATVKAAQIDDFSSSKDASDSTIKMRKERL